MQALFTPQEVEQALQHLATVDFPDTEASQELKGLPVPEPFWAYAVAASQALAALGKNGFAARAVAQVVDRVCSWVDASLGQGSEPVSVACQLGCHFCCFIRVNVLADEAKSIAAAVPLHRREAVAGRLQEFVREASKLAPRTRFMKPMLCSLNEDGRCTVYDVRPLACRSHHSFSVRECEASFNDWESNLPVTRHTLRKVCCEAAIEGYLDALGFAGEDNRVLELPEALQIALAGGENFDAAYSEDMNALE